MAASDPPVLPVGARVIASDGWYQLVVPGVASESVNEVIVSRVVPPGRIDETFALYRSLGLPFKWATGPMSAPWVADVLGPRAERSWEFRGMAVSCSFGIAGEFAGTVERVGAANFEEFLSVNLVGWGQEAIRESVRARLSLLVAHRSCRFFLARRDGVAIGSAGTVIKPEGYGYLMSAVVLPGHRGFGAYRALVRERLGDLRRLGVEFAVSQARESTSAPILERLGFETVCRGRMFRFAAGA